MQGLTNRTTFDSTRKIKMTRSHKLCNSRNKKCKYKSDWN